MQGEELYQDWVAASRRADDQAAGLEAALDGVRQASSQVAAIADELDQMRGRAEVAEAELQQARAELQRQYKDGAHWKERTTANYDRARTAEATVARVQELVHTWRQLPGSFGHARILLRTLAGPNDGEVPDA